MPPEEVFRLRTEWNADPRRAPLAESIRVSPDLLEAWAKGTRIPVARRKQLEHRRAMLAAHQELESRGMGPCETASRLHEAALSSIRSGRSDQRQRGAIDAVNSHEASCGVCRARKEVMSEVGKAPPGPSPLNLVLGLPMMLVISGYMIGGALGAWVGAAAGAAIGFAGFMYERNLKLPGRGYL